MSDDEQLAVVWHDVECGGYAQDLALWRELAGRHDGPILDIGAGTGRVTLDLARRGREVTALDLDATLMGELRRRAAGLPVEAVVADARAFELGRRFGLVLVPMQTVQLLGGRAGRGDFLECVGRHLAAGGTAALAIVEAVDAFDVPEGSPGPIPDVLERDGSVYFSQPTAVRREADGFVLERRRECVGPRGGRTVAHDVIRLDALSADELEAEARQAGLRPAGRGEIAATADHVGSLVVMLGA